MLRRKAALFLIAFAFASAPFMAQAAPLTVVNVGAPAVNCVYNTSCVVTVSDAVGYFTPPGDAGAARLQSRTYPGIAPAPAGGKFAYVYRVDMTQAKSIAADNCVTRMQIKFGPVVAEPYSPDAVGDVFVVTSGGLGSVVVATATKAGNVITFNFADPTTPGVCPGQTSYFFGLTSAKTQPIPGTAKLFFSLGGSAAVEDRVP